MGPLAQGRRHRDHGGAAAAGVDAGAGRAGGRLRRRAPAAGSPRRRWPRRDARRSCASTLDADGLRERAAAPASSRHRSRADRRARRRRLVRRTATPADLPADQRRDDALLADASTRAPLAERIEMLGRPRRDACASPPTGRARSSSRGCATSRPTAPRRSSPAASLNLCHRDGHDAPAPLVPGEPVDVRIAMKSVAYALRAGHRVRLALSTSYWPWLWPSPEPVAHHRRHRRREHAGAAGAPARTRSTTALRAVRPARDAPPLAVEVAASAAGRARRSTSDVVAGRTTCGCARDFAGARRLPSGLEYHDDDPITFTIVDDDPLSAAVECRRRIEVARASAGAPASRSTRR